MTEDFRETPQDTLVAFAKMVLASSGYRVTNYTDPLNYSSYYGEGVQGVIQRRPGDIDSTRTAAWARCADDWVGRFTEPVDAEVASVMLSNNLGPGHPVKVKKPPIPPFTEWPK